MTEAGLAVIALIAGLGHSPEDGRERGVIPANVLVEISVNEFLPYTLAHTITITAGEPVFARTDEELEGRSWSAIRISERGSETIHSSDCPELRTVALSFADLPTLLMRPMAAIAWGGEPGAGLPLEPTMKDGFETRLRFATRADDNSPAVIELRGGGAYQRWGHDSVGALLSCRDALVP